nr:MAG TPA: hypothetical protein [Crassvirales sp.]
MYHCTKIDDLCKSRKNLIIICNFVAEMCLE